MYRSTWPTFGRPACRWATSKRSATGSATLHDGNGPSVHPRQLCDLPRRAAGLRRRKAGDVVGTAGPRPGPTVAPRVGCRARGRGDGCLGRSLAPRTLGPPTPGSRSRPGSHLSRREWTATGFGRAPRREPADDCGHHGTVDENVSSVRRADRGGTGARGRPPLPPPCDIGAWGTRGSGRRRGARHRELPSGPARGPDDRLRGAGPHRRGFGPFLDGRPREPLPGGLGGAPPRVGRTARWGGADLPETPGTGATSAALTVIAAVGSAPHGRRSR